MNKMCFKIVVCAAVVVLGVSAAQPAGAQGDVLEWVDPFIGTQGTGHTTPAAACPFGMVQPGPDTSHSGWEHCSGYQYGDERIERFSQNHLSGTGCSEFTDVGFMPFAGDFDAAWSRDCYQNIDKATEKASPGYYAVTLDTGVRIEMTCTERVALYRITYLKSPAHLLFDPSWSFRAVRSADVTPMKDGRMSGHVFRDGWPSHDYYFAWETSENPVSSRVVQRIGEDRLEKTAYTFALKEGGVLYLKVSLSRTSAEGARRNMDAEIPGWDFDAVLKAAQAKWRAILSRVEAKGTDEQMKALYTSIYHLCFQPNLISDVGEGEVYSTFSCWDTYRAAGPLYTILVPERVPDFINSMLWHFDRNGYLPVWTLWGGDNQCMIGVHSVPMIVDAYLKGFKGVDWERAWGCVKTTLTKNRRRGIARYDLLDKYGWYPFDHIRNESVSRLLENCYDDACAARFAEALGKKDDARFFHDRSLTWTNCFDASTGFIRARDSKGAWRNPLDPYKIHGCDYTEGNAFHWNWHTMHAPGTLVSLMGGKDAALKRLEGLFKEDSTKGVGAIPDVTGLIGQYCHGNEPSQHVIYFFSLLGRRDLAAKYINEVMESQYGVTPDGLCGNDDCGQMSAWYVFSALGFYPFDPCGAGYVIGEAQMREVALRVGDGGKTFRVVSDCPGVLSEAVALDGRALDGVRLRHADVVKGGELRFSHAPGTKPVPPRKDGIAARAAAYNAHCALVARLAAERPIAVDLAAVGGDASGYAENESPAMAFVAEKGGKLCCDWKGSLVLTVSLADPEKVTRYTIASANDYPGRDPSTWTLYASKDGLKWMPVDEQKGVEFPSRNYIREFSLAEPVTAKAFKLVVTAHGGDGKVQFSRVTFRR